MEPPSNSSEKTDGRDLIPAIARGDRKSFETLYNQFSAPLYSLSLKMLANEAEAQDLLQEVFLTIWNKAHTYNPAQGSSFSWMVSLLRNRAIDRIRSKTTRRDLLQAYGPDLEPTGSAMISPALRYEESERARDVRAACAKLSQEQLQVIRLAFFEGMTLAKISEKLKEPLGTIKARAHRGMAKLRELLGRRHE